MRKHGGRHEARAGHNADLVVLAANRERLVRLRSARHVRASVDPIKGTRRGDAVHREKMRLRFEARVKRYG